MALLTIVAVGIWLYALIDAITTDRADVRTLPKWAWIAIIVLIPFAGIGWFLWGRPARTGDVRTAEPRPASFPRVRPPSRVERHDDEADVLLHIAERDRLLAQWADEARRRDEQKETSQD